MRKFYKFLVLASVVLSVAFNGSAQNKDLKKAQERVDSASEVIQEIMKVSDKAIPQEILDKAQAIAVFPGILKAAFIVGGQGGKGVVVRRLPGGGWSAPAFLNMGGGSFGVQIGGQKIDYVMVVTNDDGLQSLLKDKFEIGGEASISAGPVGRTAAASTSPTLGAGILTYSRSQGAFAGISLKGAVITQDKDVNQAVYNKSAKEILIDTPMAWASAPADLQRFPKTVAMYAK